MKKGMILIKYVKQLDYILIPIVFISSIVFREIRKIGINLFPRSKRIMLNKGVFPIIDHYYEPLFDSKHLYKDLNKERNLPGINLNIEDQLSLLKSFNFQSEFKNIPNQHINDSIFNFNNNSFDSGDAQYWYSLIRLKKPRNIIEIGSGNSTKMARLAIEFNNKEDSNYECNHICIEPYEMPWLENIGVKVLREKVENLDLSFFEILNENDILFIDSSHMIRPQGDVLFEFLELIPSLKSGVIIHVHDIFSPRDYPKEWVVDFVRLWNEQYLLEAFLNYNNSYKIIGALNLLYNNHNELFNDKCPILVENAMVPSSFYFTKC
jgi:hypothetical protein